MGREIHIPGEVTYEKFRSKTNDMFWAAVLIANSDVHLFSDLKRELANAYTKGKNDYPLTMLGAYELLLNYQGNEDEQSLKTKLTELVSESESEDKDKSSRKGQTIDLETRKFIEGMSFANAKLICYNCGKEDHISPNCNQPKREGSPYRPQQQITMATLEITTDLNRDQEDDEDLNDFGGCNFKLNTVARNYPITTTLQILLANRELVNRNWILFDNQSTIHIFKNKSILSDVQKLTEGNEVRHYCKGGSPS